MCISSAGSPDTTPVVINSGDFVTDATRNIVVIGDNNTGHWLDSKYRIVGSFINGGINISTSNIYLKFIYIQNLETVSGVSAGIEISKTGITNVNIESCYLKGSTSGITWYGIIDRGSTDTIVKNTILINWGRAFLSNQSAVNAYVYNSVAYNCLQGFRLGFGSLTVKNCIGQNNTDNYVGALSGDYNMSDVPDAQMPGVNSTTAAAIFADAANGDFRLLAGSPGIDQGVDLSADPSYPFNTDIIGTTRPQGSAWDIGAFELIQQSFNPAWAKHSNQIIRAL